MKSLNKTKLWLNLHGQWLVFLAIIFYTIIFSFISIWKYYNFGFNALDLAIINQVFYNSSLGNFFASSIHPLTYLGDHFTPILFLLLPIYILFKAPQTLLILQTLVLALSAWPVYLIAKKVLDKNLAVLLALAWLINPYVANINLFEFHFLPFAIFFILFAFYFYQDKKFLLFLIFSFLAMLVREDVAFIIFMFGVISIFQKRKIKWFLAPIILSVIYFLAAIKITNLFAPDQQYKFFIYYSWLGQTPLEALKNLFLKPWLLILQFFRLGNLVFFLGLLLPFAFLTLFSPFYLLLGIGIFLQLALGVSGGSGTLLELHYSSLLLPAIFIATIYSLKKITSDQLTDSKLILLIRKHKPLAFLILFTALIYSFLTMGPIVGSLKIILKPDPLLSAKKEIIKKIPSEAAVAATYQFLTPLSSRPDIYSFNYIFLGKQQFLTKDYALPQNTEYLLIDYADFVTYDLQYGNNPYFQNQYQRAIKNWSKNLNDFGLISIKDNIALYQKGADDQFSLVKILSDLPETLEAKNITLDENIKYLGFNKLDNQYQLFWEVNLPLQKIYQLKLNLGDKHKQNFYPFAYAKLYGQNFTGKKIIQTNYWFELPARNYDIKINLIEIESGGIEVSPIRSTKDVIDKENIIGPELILKNIIL